MVTVLGVILRAGFERVFGSARVYKRIAVQHLRLQFYVSLTRGTVPFPRSKLNHRMDSFQQDGEM